MTQEVLRYAAYTRDVSGGNPAGGGATGPDRLTDSDMVPIAHSPMSAPSFMVTPGTVPRWPGMRSAGTVVARFLATVRHSGDARDAASVLAPRVRAHQITSEGSTSIERSTEEYAAHVREQLEIFGPFTFQVTEVLEQADRVFVRWIQRGHHLRNFDGTPGTGRPIRDVGSAVYRVERDLIAEYWIQLDTFGLVRQLETLRGRS